MSTVRRATGAHGDRVIATKSSDRRAMRGGGETGGGFCSLPARPENAVRMFEGQWTSRLPHYEGGETDLFQRDPRPRQAAEAFGGLEGFNILELGPLEGAHSYQLEALGAGQITAVEANRKAFLRCLAVKNLYDLKTRFLLGDFEGYLEECEERFDLIYACGVLYHLTDPLWLLELFSRRTDRIFLWTHYYDENRLPERDILGRRLFRGETVSQGGLSVTYHYRSYGLRARLGRRFSGGLNPTAAWMSLDDILKALDHYGFEPVSMTEGENEHPNGPEVTIAAQRRAGG